MTAYRSFIIALLGAIFLLASFYGHSYAGYEDHGLEIISPEELKRDLAADAVAEPGAESFKNHEKTAPSTAPSDVRAPLNVHAVNGTKAIVSDEKSTQNASYKLGSGDKIKITVYGENDLSATYLVNEEGYISFPLINEIKVKNKTIFDVKDLLVAALSKGYLIDPSISIEVAEFRPIYVMGEIKSPGSYNFVADMSVRNAIALAGGFTYRVKQDDILITREIMGKGKQQIELGPDDRVLPGDVIQVEERFF
tara:strand:- start:135 stop:890 length:756 start_codon:yes stop_codon:yes gene_type:complete